MSVCRAYDNHWKVFGHFNTCALAFDRKLVGHLSIWLDFVLCCVISPVNLRMCEFILQCYIIEVFSKDLEVWRNFNCVYVNVPHLLMGRHRTCVWYVERYCAVSHTYCYNQLNRNKSFGKYQVHSILFPPPPTMGAVYEFHYRTQSKFLRTSALKPLIHTYIHH